MKRTAKLQLYLTLFATMLLLISVTAGTFAWFTFRADVNVEPISGNLGETDGSLLISNSPNGPFDTSCKLQASVPAGGLLPISTGDLNTFYTAAAQSGDGKVTGFRPTTADPFAITGTVYLKATRKSCDVFFSRDALNFGSDNQALASLRLGLRITMPGETPIVLIFNLDDMGNPAAAVGESTLPAGYDGRVASGADLSAMTVDPARHLSGYWAAKISDDPEAYSVQGKNALFRLNVQGEEAVARVDYIVYLEGCDIHCHNLTGGVPNRSLALSLGFYGGRENIN